MGLMVDGNIPDIKLEPDKAVMKVGWMGWNLAGYV